jgi:hypothetical protein
MKKQHKIYVVFSCPVIQSEQQMTVISPRKRYTCNSTYGCQNYSVNTVHISKMLSLYSPQARTNEERISSKFILNNISNPKVCIQTDYNASYNEYDEDLDQRGMLLIDIHSFQSQTIVLEKNSWNRIEQKEKVCIELELRLDNECLTTIVHKFQFNKFQPVPSIDLSGVGMDIRLSYITNSRCYYVSKIVINVDDLPELQKLREKVFVDLYQAESSKIELYEKLIQLSRQSQTLYLESYLPNKKRKQIKNESKSSKKKSAIVRNNNNNNSNNIIENDSEEVKKPTTYTIRIQITSNQTNALGSMEAILESSQNFFQLPRWLEFQRTSTLQLVQGRRYDISIYISDQYTYVPMGSFLLENLPTINVPFQLTDFCSGECACSSITGITYFERLQFDLSSPNAYPELKQAFHSLLDHSIAQYKSDSTDERNLISECSRANNRILSQLSSIES